MLEAEGRDGQEDKTERDWKLQRSMFISNVLFSWKLGGLRERILD
jgi:hypothetical protein